jgi:poly(3-hydroxybutyrate) depolymerase
MVERRPGSLGRGPVEVSTWSPGESGVGVVSYLVTGMGHVWPVGASDNLDATGVVVRAASTTAPRTKGRAAAYVDPVGVSRALLLRR